MIPVILQPADWQGAAFGALQALPVDAKPVTTWSNQEEAFTNIAQGIRAAVTEMLHPTTSRFSVDVQPASPSVMWQPLPQPALRILHLSDLHITASDDPSVRLQPLLADLRDKEGGFGFERLDYLVLSGDLTNRATPEEFDKVYQLISRLIERFDLSAERCIIVPGNHDLSWDEQVYEWKQHDWLIHKNSQ